MPLLPRLRATLDRALGLSPPRQGLATARAPASEEERSMSLSEALPRSQDGRPRPVVYDDNTALDGGLESSVWVYVCVEIIGRAISSRSFAVYDAEGEALPDHPLSLLLASPNPWWSTAQLLERVTQHLLLTGNGVITKVRGVREIPVELWALQPSTVKPIPSRSSYVEGYQFRDGGAVRLLPAEDVCHVQLSNPADPYWGLAPYRAGKISIDEDSAAREWNRANLRNSARPSGVLAFGTPLTREQWQEARWRLRQHYMGAANAGIPFVSGGDAKWTPFDRTPLEMDFLSGRRLTREEICAVFGVPPVLAGILDRATYSNYEVAETVFWRQTVVPLLTLLAGQLTSSLGPDFGLRPGEHVWYDEAGIPGAKRIDEATAKVASTLFSFGVPVALISRRLELELPRFPGDEISYLPSGIVPASLLATDPANPTPEPPQAPQARSLYDSDLSPEENAQALLRALEGAL